MGKVALVTGASRGIGAATALALARQGCDVAVNFLSNKDQAEQVVSEIEAVGQKALAIQADVGQYDQVSAMIQQIAGRLGGVQILINNAGYSSHGTLEELSPGDWRAMCAVTLDAAFYCAKETAPRMQQAGWGRIVNVCSLRAMTGSDHGSHYASAKAGLIGFTKSLALELAPHTTVNAISPGYTVTDMTRQSLETKGDAITATIPLGRAGEPEEVAALIAFLCSDGGGYITGETINVNGGIYMR